MEYRHPNARIGLAGSCTPTDSAYVEQTDALPPHGKIECWFVARSSVLAVAGRCPKLPASCDFLEDLASGFVTWVLRHEQAADRELQDGLFDGVDGFGAVEEQVEVGGDALPVFGQRVGGFAGGERVEQRGVEPRMLFVAQSTVRFQRIAELHQFFDGGDDARLFGDRWKQSAIDRLRVWISTLWMVLPAAPISNAGRAACGNWLGHQVRYCTI